MSRIFFALGATNLGLIAKMYTEAQAPLGVLGHAALGLLLAGTGVVFYAGYVARR